MIPFDPDKIAEELSKRGHAWADTDAAWRALDEVTKTVLAECEIEAKQDNATQAAIERAGRVAGRYREHLGALAEARRLANRARVNYDTFQVWIALKRTEQATIRTQMELR
jgi:hypothetical protein